MHKVMLTEFVVELADGELVGLLKACVYWL